jgi:hypothetical protein
MVFIAVGRVTGTSTKAVFSKKPTSCVVLNHDRKTYVTGMSYINLCS